MTQHRPDRALSEHDVGALLSVLDLHRPLRLPIDPEPDWPALLALARRAKVLPTLADRVLTAEVPVADADVRDTLREALHATAVYNTRALGELARASRVLRAGGIEHVALKGTVLVTRHYPRAAMRHLVDIDLLVEPARLDAALARLEAVGYVDAPQSRELSPDGRSRGRALGAHSHAAVPLAGPSGVQLDLHTRVPAWCYEATGGFAGWRARARPLSLSGLDVPLCAPLDLAAHLCEHFALQYPRGCAPRGTPLDPLDAPRLLCDLRAMFPAGPPFAALQLWPARQRAAVALVARLYRAAFESGAQGAGATTRLLRRLAVADPGVARPLSSLSIARGQLARAGYDLRHRPRYALRTLLPTREFIAASYGIEPRSPRIYGLYARRLWDTARRALRV